MCLSQNKINENQVKLASFYKNVLGQKDIFSSSLLRQLLIIRQQDCGAILFHKVG